MKFVESSMGLQPLRVVGCALDFVGKVVMQNGRSNRVNAMRKVNLKHLYSIFHYNLSLAWLRQKGSFRVLKQVSQGALQHAYLIRSSDLGMGCHK